MTYVHPDETTFESGCDMMEATSLHRPDPSWRFVDALGHEHRWYVAGRPADRYGPEPRYETPSLVCIEDSPATDEYPAISHHECAICGERIEPRFTADTYATYVPGLRWFRLNGRRVTEEEFLSAARARGINV